MINPALRQAWTDWRSFCAPLDLSVDADCRALHGRLFRLCGADPMRARHLDATRQAIEKTFGPWFEQQQLPDTLERLRQAMTACEPGWGALLGWPPARLTDWDDLQRVALAAGLRWPDTPLWVSPLFVGGFSPLLCQRGRDHATALGMLDALLRILNHPDGNALWTWLSNTPDLEQAGQALAAASIFRDAVEEGVLTTALLPGLGWQPLVQTLADLCEDVCLVLFRRLNEEVPATSAGTATAPSVKGSQPGRQRRAAYHRTPPEPLPIEPYFQNIPGSEAFLRAIAEEPLEDSHRLAFADWLEDQGHPARAEYIRLECHDALLPEFHPVQDQLRARLDELFAQNKEAWLADLPQRGVRAWNSVNNFRRGMLEHPGLLLGLPPDHEQMVTAIDVRGVDVAIEGGEQLRWFLQSSWLSQLVSLRLEVQADFTEEDLIALARSPALAGLVHLRLNWAGYGYSNPLLESLNLPRLQTLDLDGFNAGSLIRCPVLGNLRVLRLENCYPDLGTIRTLAASPLLANLTTLAISWAHYNLSPQAIEPLAASPFLAGLRTLELRHLPVGNKGAKALATSPYLTQLSALNLSGADIRTEGVRLLARSANSKSLRVLDLSNNDYLTNESIRMVANSPHLSELEALNLGDLPFPLGKEEMEAFTRSAHLGNLTALALPGTSISDEAVRILAASPHLNKLTFLDLRDNQVARGAKNAIRKRWPFALFGKRR